MAARTLDFALPFSLEVSVRVTHNELNERGTNRSPKRFIFTELFLYFICSWRETKFMFLIKVVRE